MRANRIDTNQAAIVEALRKAGAGWVPCTADPNLGCDGLILIRSKVIFAEIKDEAKPPSARRLTENEEKRKRQCEAHGIPYVILLNPEQALMLISEAKNDNQNK